MKREDVIFTTRCTGDLGVIIDGRVVAQLFESAGGFNVYDLVAAGDPQWFRSLSHALSAMAELARDYEKR